MPEEAPVKIKKRIKKRGEFSRGKGAEQSCVGERGCCISARGVTPVSSAGGAIGIVRAEFSEGEPDWGSSL